MKPSWLRWPPNCCQTCTGPWQRLDEWTGRCGKAQSLEFGLITDARFRCPAFERKPDAEPMPAPVVASTPPPTLDGNAAETVTRTVTETFHCRYTDNGHCAANIPAACLCAREHRAGIDIEAVL